MNDSPTLRLRGWIPFLLAVAMVCAGCAGDGPPPTSATGSSFDVVQREIFQMRCLDAGCHNSTDQAEGLNLESGFSYGALINVVPRNVAARSAGLLRVVPGVPEGSFLLFKLLGPPSQFGTRMPQGKPALSAADIQLVRAWIEEGAPGPSGPALTATATATITDTPTITETPTDTVTPTISATATISPTGTLPPSPTVTQSATRTASGTPTPTASPTVKPTILAGSRFTEIQANIFDVSCMSEGCHTLRDQAGGQILDAVASYDQLVGATPTQPNAVSRGFLRVKPGDPDNSFLLVKLTLPTAFDPVFSARMPQAMPALSAQQIEQIRAWILRGALRDE